MSLQISKAVREKRPARILICGPSGSGKTFTALRIAHGLAGEKGRILLLDTERGSAKLYSDVCEFDTADLPDCQYDTYIKAVKEAAELKYDVLVVDSASHAWSDLLDQHNKMQGNSFANWGKIGGKYDELVRTLVNYPYHIIVTCRAKMKYEQNDKKQVMPIGLDPIMRDGFEYEFDLYGMIDIDHNMTIRKTRIEQFADKIINKPGATLGYDIATWLAGGVDAPRATRTQRNEPTETIKVWRYKIDSANPETLPKIVEYLSKEEIAKHVNFAEGVHISTVELKPLENYLI